MKAPDRKGQSLLEAMIALGVLMTGFLGIMTLLSQSFFLSRTTSDRLTATYLASEGIELAKNLIDHDVYAGNGWGACFAIPVGGSGDYEVDYATLTQGQSCPPAAYGGRHLIFDQTAHLYGYNFSNAADDLVVTGFTRDVRVAVPAASQGNEIVVTSIVGWPNGQTIMLEDHFYNWRP
ncbi:MAG: hypothetical protein ABSE18_02965 [Minisyncoccia bacterium]|jgi:Tfp pilus assembly protein PilV